MFLILVGDWQRDMRVPCPLPKYNNLVKYIFINYTYDLLQGINIQTLYVSENSNIFSI